MSSESLSEPAKNLLLVSLLASDNVISNNGKCFLKELILRRDPRITELLRKFEAKEAKDSNFLEELHTLIEDESFALYNELFYDTSLELGKSLSKTERDSNDLNEDKSLIYGEVDYTSFYKVLRKINPVQGSTFYDLGSGTAKAVFIARLTQDFGRCLGIEILESLHSQAQKIVERYNNKFRSYLCTGLGLHASVHVGSFLDYDWSDGDVVFANSTCFDDQLMDSMSKRAESLRPGSIFITFTKGLTSPKFEVIERKRYRMSWGPATVYIQRRLKDDGTPVGPANLRLLPIDNVPYQDEDFSYGTKDSLSTLSTGKYGIVNLSSSDSDEDDEEEDDNDEEEEEEEEELDGYEEDDEPDPLATPFSPPGAFNSPAIKIKTGPGLLRGQNTEYLNSPQDSALLKRKRVAQAAHPIE